MTSENGKFNILGFSGLLLRRREWIYSLSLLMPFVAYNLTLKAYDVASQPGDHGLVRTLDLMQSAIFFNIGYALFWIGLLDAVRGGPLYRTVVVLFHAAVVLVVIVTTCAHGYFRQTGVTLDYGVAGWVSRFNEVLPILASEVPLSAWILLAVTLLYTLLGPLFVTRALTRFVGQRDRRVSSLSVTPGISFLGSLALLLLALGFGSLSLLATSEEVSPYTIPGAVPPASNASLAETPRTEKRNVVLIHLESVRAQSVTPYNKNLKTMPFLDELSKSSLLAEHARVVVPRSSKGSTAVNCGVEPTLYPGREFDPSGIPSPCLAGLLKQQGYRTVFFQSVSNAANSYWDDDLARNFGYEEFYSSEHMDTTGFQVTNSFGYEEDVMLEPSEDWLRANYDKPFLAQYFTGTGHYGYDCVPNRYGYERFSEDEELDRYHNCLRMLDHFLENLFDQYKRLGLYEDTIFVMYGDHGEGFREHGRYMHGDNPYEEGLRVPLLIHAPGWFEDGERAKGLSSQIDILPTVLGMLGYNVAGEHPGDSLLHPLLEMLGYDVVEEYPGYSLLHPLPEDRVLMSSCVYPYRCMASLKGTEKYIYHYGDQPDEFFDLSEDPLEKENLADERSKEVEERRKALLQWRSSVDATY